MFEIIFEFLEDVPMCFESSVLLLVISAIPFEILVKVLEITVLILVFVRAGEGGNGTGRSVHATAAYADADAVAYDVAYDACHVRTLPPPQPLSSRTRCAATMFPSPSPPLSREAACAAIHNILLRPLVSRCAHTGRLAEMKNTLQTFCIEDVV